MGKATQLLFMFSILLLVETPQAFASSAGVTYQGRIFSADGTPLVATVVQFRIQIRTPQPEACLMYQETQVKDLSRSQGMFTLTLNDGTASVPNVEPFTLDEVFQNGKTINFAAGKCLLGATSLTLNAATSRQIWVSFREGNVGPWENLPNQQVNFVPMAFTALDSQTVGGVQGHQIFRVVDGANQLQTLSPWSVANYNRLVGILNGSENIGGSAAGFTGSLAGDVTGTQSATLVTALQGNSVSAVTPSTGQVLKWDGSAWTPDTDDNSGGGGGGSVTSVNVSVPGFMTTSGGPITASGTIALGFSSQAQNAVFAGPSSGSGVPGFRSLLISDVRAGSVGNPAFWNISGVCAVGEMPTHSSVTDQVTCEPYSLTSTQVTTALGYTPLQSSDISGLVPNSRTVTAGTGLTGGGDLSANRTLAVNVGTGANQIPQLDGSGKLAGSVIPDLSWSQITSGTPTTLAGYGITNAVTNAGNTPSIQSGLNGARPSAGTAGRLYVSTDTQQIYRDDGSNWILVGTGAAGGGTVTNIATGTGLTGGPITGTGTISIAAGGVSSTELASNAVTTVKIADSQVTTAKIADAQVTDAKITAVAVNKVASGAGLYLTYQPDGTACSPGQVLKWNNSRWECGADNDSATGVTSVDVSVPAYMTSTGGAITSSGTIALGFASQAQNAVFAGPASGSGAPSFRNLFIADIKANSAGNPAFWNISGACPAGQMPTHSSVTDQVSCVAYALTSSQVTTALGFTPADNSAAVLQGGNPVTGTMDIGTNSNHNLGFETNGTTRMTLDTSGRLGIGTASPSRMLEVVGTTLSPLLVHRSTTETSVPRTTAIYKHRTSGTIAEGFGVDFTFAIEGNGQAEQAIAHITAVRNGNNSSGRLDFGTYSSGTLNTRMSILPGGNVGIGLTNPSERLQVDGKVRATEFCIDGDCLSSWPTSSGGTLTGVTGTANQISVDNTNAAVPALSLADLAISPAGSYGSATQVPALTVDAKGRVTAVSNTSISITTAQVSDFPTLGTAAAKNFGSSSGNLVELDGAGRIPASLLPTTAVTTSTGFIQNGNSFGAPAVLGTNDSHPLSFETQGTTRMTVTDTGNVGIGTSTPGSALDVAGEIELNDSLYFSMMNSTPAKVYGAELQPYIWNSTPGAEGTGLAILAKTGGTWGYRMSVSDRVYVNVPLQVDAGFAQILSFSNSNSAGPNLEFYRARGTSGARTPALLDDKLFVIGASSYHSGNSWHSAFGAYLGSYLTENPSPTAQGSDLRFFTTSNGTASGVERVRISHNGNVGIGTTNPSSVLHARSPSTATLAVATVETTGASGRPFLNFRAEGADYGWVGFGTTGEDAMGLVNYRNNALRLGTNSTIRMTILGDGNVGIGTTSPTQRFVVFNGSTTGSYTTGGWAHSSDSRLKEQIVPLESSLEKILQLQGVSYKFKADPEAKTQLGFIAQEVEPLFPEVVQTDDKGFKSMVYSNLVAPVIEAMKEIYDRLVRTERQVASVDDRVQTLEMKELLKDEKIQRLESENAQMKARLEKLESLLIERSR